MEERQNFTANRALTGFLYSANHLSVREAFLLGTIVNTIAIIAGSLFGLLLKGGIPKRYSTTVMHAMALAVIAIGLKGGLASSDLLLMIFSLAIGSALGEWLRIEDGLAHLGGWLERRMSASGGDFSKGFVAASLLFCVGSMAVVGSMESGLTGNHQTLFAKSVLDGIASVVFASSLGIGVLFSAFSVLCYQGAITLTASLVKPLLVPEVIAQMSAVGGLLIAAIGINLLEIKKLRVGNMLPAIFIPLIYHVGVALWRSF
jgi:uncharacterized protein